MADKRIIELPTASEVEDNDFIPLDNSLNGTRKFRTKSIGEYINLEDIPQDATHRTVTDSEKATWNAKQNALTFDDVPTQNSNNPVKSGGVYTALSGKQDTLTFDDVPTNGSNNPVKSNGIYDELEKKTNDSSLATVAKSGSYNDLTDKPAIPEVYGEATGDLITIDDAMEAPLEDCKVTLEPQQDLHGYDRPWVGGAGKNKLSINSLSIAGSGVTATIDRDSNNNVVSVTVNGTASGVVYVVLNTFTLPSGTYTMSGCPSNGGDNSYRLYDDKHTSWKDDGSGSSFTLSEASQVRPTIRIANGYTVNNLKFYPMIESGNTKTTFAPYSNICPISGWSAVDVNVSGANQWDEKYNVSGTGIKAKNLIRVLPNATYYFESPCDVAYYRYDANKNYIDSLTLAKGTSFTTLSNQYYMWFDAGDNYGNTTYNHDISINYPSTDTEYHAYSGQVYTINLGDTYYGGELDAVNGVLKVTDGYIASYNGETLPSTWISDRDVYAPNTSPTTGAEVVYKLSTPTEVTLTPTEVTLLLGVNNLWSDGEMYVKYRRDLDIFLNKLEARVRALEEGTNNISSLSASTTRLDTPKIQTEIINENVVDTDSEEEK